MDFTQLVSDFAQRHGIANLAAEDNAAALDIDGIVVMLVTTGDTLSISAEIGEPPAEGAAVFANLLLEANMQPGAFFARAPEQGMYFIVLRLPLRSVDDDAFDSALESFVNQTETWRRLLADFRPIAKATAERAESESPSFGSTGFMPV